MASLLFTFGDTTNQAHAATKDTQPPAITINDVISAIDAQRTQTAQSLWTLDGFGPSYNDYYRQAASDYDTFIEPQVNNWLANLVTEAQQNVSLNSDINNDQPLIINAMSESYRLNDWANNVATSISSGSGIEPLIDFSEVDSNAWLDLRDKLSNGLGNYVSDCIHQIRTIEQWWPSGSPLSGQPLSPPQCQPAPPFSQTSQSSDDTSQPSDTPKTCFLGICF
jgi:hypothetical protein